MIKQTIPDSKRAEVFVWLGGGGGGSNLENAGLSSEQ